MGVLKVQLSASEVGIFFKMINQLSTHLSITKNNITSIAQGLKQTHSKLILGTVKFQLKLTPNRFSMVSSSIDN